MFKKLKKKNNTEHVKQGHGKDPDQSRDENYNV